LLVNNVIANTRHQEETVFLRAAGRVELDFCRLKSLLSPVPSVNRADKNLQKKNTIRLRLNQAALTVPFSVPLIFDFPIRG
jgi:hypothetical protein